jgi:cellulose synthase/poly-beta-1,6-N-acetylglucosamine synthase-like glycosyltransferase
MIVGHDIVFSKRHSGKAKIRIISATFQIAWSALELKFIRANIIPFATVTATKKGKGFHYRGREFIHHSNLSHTKSAFHRLSGVQIAIMLGIIILTTEWLILDWHTTIIVFLAFLTFLYFIDLLFNLYLIHRSLSKHAEIHISDAELSTVDDMDWPAYTVFCPLYKEWQVLPQFVTAMSGLDYPKEKLQIMLLLEEDDSETINRVRDTPLPFYFDIVIVPNSFPKTKPKACNYGLQYARGAYTVIYDAEDIPDPLQLKKAVLAFQKAGAKTICVQAKLNFYNPHQNLLTRVFTAEYSLWFDLILTGLQSIHAPIPLGGTSNHFRTGDLHKLKGWDSFNVTEDCDLGVRLVKEGYETAVIDSLTLEEANSGMKNWFWQRTRWIKGYMQTYLLHMRDPKDFFHDWREPHIVTFQLVVGGKVTSMFINPVMWVITICYFLFRVHVAAFVESFFPTPVLYMGVFSLLVGNFLYMYYYMIGCAKHGHHELVKYVILVPFYWLAMSAAAWVAFYKLIVAPHQWSKTRHGLHLQNKKTFIAAPVYI